jgi:hypothetical protein
MANVTLKFIDGDAGSTFEITAPEDVAVKSIYRKIKCDAGPLSVQPRDAVDLADRISDAFGGECGLEILRSPA